MGGDQLREIAMKAGYSIAFTWEWERSNDVYYEVTVTDIAGETTTEGGRATRDQMRLAESPTIARESISQSANERLLKKMGWSDLAAG